MKKSFIISGPGQRVREKNANLLTSRTDERSKQPLENMTNS